MVHIPLKTKQPFTNRSVYSKDFCRTPVQYQRCSTGTFRRRESPQVVTEPPFEITENLVNDGTTYRETFSTRHPATYTDYPAAGLITRGGRLRTQRETYQFYSSPRSLKTDRVAKLARQTKAHSVQNRLDSNEQDTKELHQIRVKQNVWPFLEHKNSCFYNVAVQDDF
ncbi:hypothetical protein P879_03456 [Paragonimus westermani]|uniref:Uncharacterized protein n=1 Tax=Paragonimus westermani TaxID=34504 RepID=A0A8T0DPD2_9TREM|nr:hypothetical protein P879_03456 [Paragonimus westermani]